MKLLLLMLMCGISLGQHVRSVEKDLLLATVPFDTDYNSQACSNIVSDERGKECLTWKSLSTQSYGANNSFGKWITSGTKIRGLNESISVNSAPAGIVPDMYYTYTGNIGGILSRRRVKTTVYVDRMDCLNQDCTWIGDSRYVVDKCEELTTSLAAVSPELLEETLSCQAQQWVFNVLKGTRLAVGRQLALDSNITQKYVEVSRSVRVQHPVADTSVSFEAKIIRYYSNDNRTNLLDMNDSRNIDISNSTDPLKGIKDSTMHSILNNLYNDVPGIVIRAIHDGKQCRLFAVKNLYCDSNTSLDLNFERGLKAKPIIDSCDYDKSKPVSSLLASSSEVLSIVYTELYDLHRKGSITNEIISDFIGTGPLTTFSDVLFSLVDKLQTGFNTSVLYQLGYMSYIAKYNDLPLQTNATQLIELAIGPNSSIACFNSNNINSTACRKFNADQRIFEPTIPRQFDIIENNGNMWLEFNMSDFYLLFGTGMVPAVNWDGLFSFINNDVICIDVYRRKNEYGMSEVDRWHYAMETLIYPRPPNFFRSANAYPETEPGVHADCFKGNPVSLIDDVQYLADIVVKATSNALQTVSPTLTHASAAISVVFVIMSCVALLLTFENKHTHNIAVVITLLVLLASIGVLLADNINTQSQNNLFLNNAIIVEKFPVTSCQTSYPMYISAIYQTYVGDRYANVILWIGIGLILLSMLATIVYVISKKCNSVTKSQP